MLRGEWQGANQEENQLALELGQPLWVLGVDDGPRRKDALWIWQEGTCMLF